MANKYMKRILLFIPVVIIGPLLGVYMNIKRRGYVSCFDPVIFFITVLL